MPEKNEYLCVYDYGMGGIWLVMSARSPDEIEKRFPGITAYADKPEWMKQEEKTEYFSRCKEKGFRWDIDDEPTGWLKTYVGNQKR